MVTGELSAKREEVSSINLQPSTGEGRGNKIPNHFKLRKS